DVEEIRSGQIRIREDSLVDRELKSLDVFGEPRVQRHHVIIRVFEPNGVSGFAFGFHDENVPSSLELTPRRIVSTWGLGCVLGSDHSVAECLKQCVKVAFNYC